MLNLQILQHQMKVKSISSFHLPFLGQGFLEACLGEESGCCIETKGERGNVLLHDVILNIGEGFPTHVHILSPLQLPRSSLDFYILFPVLHTNSLFFPVDRGAGSLHLNLCNHAQGCRKQMHPLKPLERNKNFQMF